MVFCGESIITEISVYVFFYMSEFIIQSTRNYTTAIGTYSSAIMGSTALGAGTYAGTNSAAVGRNTYANSSAVAMGVFSRADNGVAIGQGATAGLFL